MLLETRLWARAGPDLIWGEEQGESPVFDPVTGETHFLSELPALILSVIDAAPVSHTELIDRLAGPVDLDDQAEAKVIAALVYLEGAELVESIAPTTE